MSDRPDLLRGVVAGLAAGLVASFAMDLAQKGLSMLSSDDGGGGEPATEQAADRVSQSFRGEPVAEDYKSMAGQTVHYGFGALLGLAYGVAAEYRPQATYARGTAFGLGSALLFDETAVPAAGLGEAPWNTRASTHLYAVASHLVFGSVAEAARRLVRSAI